MEPNIPPPGGVTVPDVPPRPNHSGRNMQRNTAAMSTTAITAVVALRLSVTARSPPWA